MMMKLKCLALAALPLAAACATAGLGSASPAPGGGGTTGSTIQRTAPVGWRVGAREDVDLWLHGFAMLTSDTGRVPFFARGYKQAMLARKRQQRVVTLLDANQQDLSARFAANPALTNAQFLAMYFPSFQEIVNATDYFIRSGGNPGAASDPQMQQEIALLAANFRSPADRNWLRLFIQSLQDERTKFYHAYWTGQQQARGAAYAQFNTQWIAAWYPKLSRFLNNTQQGSGEVLLSLPLGGEGRTVNDGKESNTIAVEFPASPDSAVNALYVVAHEAVAGIVAQAISDNTTPAEQRSGATEGYTGNGAVRGGALLLQRVAPDLVAGYMRYYIRETGAAAPAGDPTSAFDGAFPLPAAVAKAISSQIEIVLSGI